MAERGILFSAPMVRALLAGTKTQTRRAVKPQPIMRDGEPIWPKDARRPKGRGFEDCPYGRPGDRLWVRETWCQTSTHGIVCRADGEISDEFGPWKPSIHMPRWASRITLEITDVRVERLQEISEADAIAEGIERLKDHPLGFPVWKVCDHQDGTPGVEVLDYVGRDWTKDPRRAYQALWLSINGPGSWDANPWVWVIEFRRIDGAAAMEQSK